MAIFLRRTRVTYVPARKFLPVSPSPKARTSNARRSVSPCRLAPPVLLLSGPATIYTPFILPHRRVHVPNRPRAPSVLPLHAPSLLPPPRCHLVLAGVSLRFTVPCTPTLDGLYDPVLSLGMPKVLAAQLVFFRRACAAKHRLLFYLHLASPLHSSCACCPSPKPPTTRSPDASVLRITPPLCVPTHPPQCGPHRDPPPL